MSAIQVCARCGSRWRVPPSGMQWCPRCHGVLLTPVDEHRHVPPERRGFRWTARTPGKRARVTADAEARSSSPPRYREIPRWGLVDPVAPAPGTQRDRVAELAARTPALLACAAVLYVVAAIAEFVRYGILVRNRSVLIDPTVLAVSDAAVAVSQVAALLVAVGAAAAAIAWLVRMRRRVYGDENEDDPRSTREIVLGCALPIVNLVMPAIYLLEVVRRDPWLRKAILAVWSLWVIDVVFVVAATAWRTRDSLQAMADGVALSGVVALVAATVATGVLVIVRRFEGRTASGRPRTLARWVVSSDAARDRTDEVAAA
ncbi:DUF4328 domain-containing protein [Rhodococcus rhodnii]|uniref:DUF4328 domain-containing protein n=1 Tax=Rhodococcus rhodnii TaxID=38312 RepID=UPI0003AAF82B|nr:DUF4328 domain-containing protein [Rhodococcus rhodnii]